MVVGLVAGVIRQHVDSEVRPGSGTVTRYRGTVEAMSEHAGTAWSRSLCEVGGNSGWGGLRGRGTPHLPGPRERGGSRRARKNEIAGAGGCAGVVGQERVGLCSGTLREQASPDREVSENNGSNVILDGRLWP